MIPIITNQYFPTVFAPCDFSLIPPGREVLWGFYRKAEPLLGSCAGLDCFPGLDLVHRLLASVSPPASLSALVYTCIQK